MAYPKKAVLALTVMLSQIGLHLISIAAIIVGAAQLPSSMKPRHLSVAKWRAGIWIILELLYLALMCSILAYSVIPAIRNSAVGLKLGTSLSKKYPNANFFYYFTLSTLVLYGVMIGCNIPSLFNKRHRFQIQIQVNTTSNTTDTTNTTTTTPTTTTTTTTTTPAPEPPHSTPSWRILIMSALASSLLNALLYLMVAIFPLDSTQTDLKDKPAQEDTNKDGDLELRSDRIVAFDEQLDEAFPNEDEKKMSTQTEDGLYGTG